MISKSKYAVIKSEIESTSGQWSKKELYFTKSNKINRNTLQTENRPIFISYNIKKSNIL